VQGSTNHQPTLADLICLSPQGIRLFKVKKERNKKNFNTAAKKKETLPTGIKLV
jgi:hypothetical protein